jgi:hypothetical protein
VVAPIVEKMIETRLRYFEHVEIRHMDYVVRRIDQMEGSLITRGRKDLEIKESEIDLVFDRTLL